MSAFYEAVDADGHPRTFGCRFGEDEFDKAKAKATKLRGYVRHGWTVVWDSPAYRKRHPSGGGSGGGPVEQVEPPRSLWANEGAREWAGF